MRRLNEGKLIAIRNDNGCTTWAVVPKVSQQITTYGENINTLLAQIIIQGIIQ